MLYHRFEYGDPSIDVKEWSDLSMIIDMCHARV